MTIFLNVLLDTLKDTALVIPILYLAYLLVGYFGHNNNEKYSKILHHTKKAGPVVGAFLGCVPQCGFSSVMSRLYSSKVVTLGTLIAVFIATSDEAIPLMIAKPEFIPKLLILIGIKVVFAIVVGYLIDLIVHIFTRKSDKLNDFVDPPHHDERECCAKNIFLDALKHTAIITAYVFVTSLAIGLLIGYVGLDNIKAFFSSNVSIYLQVLIACLVGLIPNCAASVALVELYLSGVLAFPALVGGLCAGAGVGLIVLFTTHKKPLVDLGIMALLFALALGCGYLTILFNIV